MSPKPHTFLFFLRYLLLLIFVCTVVSGPAIAETTQALPTDFNEALKRSMSQVAFTRTPPQLQSPQLSDHYTFDTEDQLTVDLQSPKISQTHNLTVNGQGAIFIPRLGHFSVKGLSREALSTQILARVYQRFGKAPLEVSVFLRQARDMTILVSGQVNKPGSHKVPQGTPLLELIRTAGGVLDTGSIMRVELRRQQANTSVNLWRFLTQGNIENNPILQSGDHIHIPVMPFRMMAFGAFQSVGIYEVPGPISVDTLIAYAGGTLPNAATLVHWERLLTDRQAQGVPVQPKQLLQPGDALYAPPRQISSVTRSVLLQGMIKQPGSRAWQEGLRLLDVLEQAGGALPNADLSQVQLSRLNSVTQQRETRSLNLQAYLQGERSADDNPLLAAGDIITFPESFFNIRNTTLLLSTLGIVSVVINLSTGSP